MLLLNEKALDGLHFVLCLQKRLPKSGKYRTERPPSFYLLFVIRGFIWYSARRNGSQEVRNTGRSARHLFVTFLEIQGRAPAILFVDVLRFEVLFYTLGVSF